MAPLIDELDDAIRDFKANVRTALHIELIALRDKTGITPSSIQIEMIDQTTYGDKRRKFTLGSVSLGFDL